MRRGPGGSRKGIVNKRSQALLDYIQDQFPNYHPVLDMAAIANDPSSTKDQRLAADKEVAKYVTPQLKSVEHTGDASSPLHHIVSANPMSLDEWEASQKEPE